MIAEGSGPPVLLLHGSGPGTTAAAWRSLITALAPRFRVLAPDLLGFGSSPMPSGSLREAWTAQALDVVADLESFAVVGNSAGGAIALALACARPRAVKRVVAVGSMGLAMPLPAGLDELWGYGPASLEAAAALNELIAPATASAAAAAARYEASLAQPWYGELFPAPRQRWVDDLALSAGELASVAAPVLLVHGSQDRVVPLRDSFLGLLDALPDVRGHVFGGCGHATPLERADEFNRLVTSFLEIDR
ncbi:MAG TPA: alpha/beta hydrolase [Solirubrobacter sp.]|nr:alpha/beta hydrolase [Solirubrobacter sp.]